MPPRRVAQTWLWDVGERSQPPEWPRTRALAACLRFPEQIVCVPEMTCPACRLQSWNVSPVPRVESESHPFHHDRCVSARSPLRFSALPPELGPRCRCHGELRERGKRRTVLGTGTVRGPEQRRCFALLHEKLPHPGHSRESGNPPSGGPMWAPAYARMTTTAIFISFGGPQGDARFGRQAAQPGRRALGLFHQGVNTPRKNTLDNLCSI
jgi:hypothetical protein